MSTDLYSRAKKAKNPAEIMEIAKSFNFPITEHQAEMYFNQLNQSGELCDDELDSVVGGICIQVNGQKYTMVTSLCPCFNGSYISNFTKKIEKGGGYAWDLSSMIKTDFKTQRENFARCIAPNAKVCGSCQYVSFQGTFGYCILSKE